MNQTEDSAKMTAPDNSAVSSKRLTRSSSIEKLRRFNSYICSAHFHMLPALLTWLSSADKRMYLSQNPRHTLALIFRQSTALLDNDGFVKMAAYACAFIVASQLIVCCYLLCDSTLPSGLLFLLACVVYINVLHLGMNWNWYSMQEAAAKRHQSRRQHHHDRQHAD